MQENKNDLSAFEMLFEDFKNKLNQELNIYEKLSNEDYKQLLTSFIKEYESEFYNNFSEIFIYDYYKSLINNNVMNKILDFVQQRQSLNNQGKNEILKAERISCKDVLNFYNFDLKQNSSENMFVSGITGKAIPINYITAEIITNEDIFFRPPKGDPKLRGPHVNYTIEYSYNYWVNFKEQILKYIDDFEKNHSEDFLEDLNDYRYWLNKYHMLKTFLNQKETVGNLKGGKNNVKN